MSPSRSYGTETYATVGPVVSSLQLRETVGVKKALVRLLVLTASLALLALAIPQSAIAHHQPGHHCQVDPHTHSRQFYKNQAEQQDISVGAARQQHRHHKHQCHTYPPRAGKAPSASNPNTSGSSATLPAASQPAITVGVALAIIVGGVIAFLIIRRRWVFSSRR